MMTLHGQPGENRTIVELDGHRFEAMHTLLECAAIAGVVRELKPGMIVEIGAWYGGLTALLCGAGEVEVFSFETGDRGYPSMATQAALPLATFIRADVFEHAELVIELLRLRKDVLLYCDGGNKVREVNLFAPHIAPGGVTGCHDWGREIRQPDVEAVLAGFEPFMPEATATGRSRFWRRKTTVAGV